jgi:hypothetical protein
VKEIAVFNFFRPAALKEEGVGGEEKSGPRSDLYRRRTHYFIELSGLFFQVILDTAGVESFAGFEVLVFDLALGFRVAGLLVVNDLVRFEEELCSFQRSTADQEALRPLDNLLNCSD